MATERDISEAREDIKEINRLLEVAERPKVKSFLSVELRRHETKLTELLEELNLKEAKTNDSTSQEKRLTNSYDVQYKNYSWDQSDKFVKFYLMNLKNVQGLPDPDGFEKNFNETSVKFRVCNLEGKNHVFEIKQLAYAINAEKSYYKVKSDYVVIFLAKKKPGQHWSHVTAAEKAKADKKNEAPKMDDDDGDPSKGLMNMMKKMYDEGDDDMKRTIAKAWTESRDKNPGAGMTNGLGDMDL